MRVLQVHWAFPPTTGGVESHVADLAARLQARGCAVTVVTGEEHPEHVAGVDVRSTELLNLGVIRGGLGGDTSHRRQLRDELDGLISETRPNVVHGHNLHHFAVAPALVLDELRHRHGYAIVHTFHETWPDVLHDMPVYRRWDANLAASQHVAGECAARIGFRPVARPLAVDTSRFRSERSALSTPGPPVILHPARLLPWKGVHVSVRMLSELHTRGFPARLVITDTAHVADWHDELAGYRLNVLALADELGLAEDIELRAAPYAAMPGLYEEADVVVYPTVAAEPFGLVPLEAMSAERPVIASRCGGIPETVVDGVTGWLVEPDDPSALAERVADVIKQPDVARRMGAAGRRHVQARFDLDCYVDDVLDIYRRASMAK
jgi:glycosyltransferase involved in cell wall biosynthesis